MSKGDFIKYAVCRAVFSIFLLASLPVTGSDFSLRSFKSLQKEGVELQTLDYSCGAAALALLLRGYFGDDLSESLLLQDIAVHLSQEELMDREVNGFSMLDLKRAVYRLGYVAEGIMLDRDSVFFVVEPVIILLRRKTSTHFVVLKGVSGGRAFIADPARGHLRLPLYELFSEWQGETLYVERLGLSGIRDSTLIIPQEGSVFSERDSARNLLHIK